MATSLQYLIQNSQPQFISDSATNLKIALDLFADYLETQAGFTDAEGLITLRGIDTTSEENVALFLNEFAKDIPTNLSMTPDDFIKNVKAFYASKGSEDSFKFLFRVLYASEVNIIYPGDDVLRASDGKWSKDTTLRVTTNDSDKLNDLFSRLLVHENGATATIEYGILINTTEGQVIELFLSNIVGNIDEPGSVSVALSLSTFNADILPGNEVYIQSPGTGYQTGDTFYIKVVNPSPDDVRNRTLARGQVGKVGADGEIITTYIIDFGLSPYPDDDPLTTPEEIAKHDENVIDYANIIVEIESEFGSGAVLQSDLTYLCQYQGRFLNSDGFLSSDKVLQDNYYYQDYSYVIQTGVPFTAFEDMVRESIHPAGFLFFGELYSESEFLNNIELDIDYSQYIEVNHNSSYAQNVTTNMTTELLFQDGISLGYASTVGEIPLHYYQTLNLTAEADKELDDLVDGAYRITKLNDTRPRWAYHVGELDATYLNSIDINSFDMAMNEEIGPIAYKPINLSPTYIGYDVEIT